MLKTMKINKSQIIGRKPLGVIKGCEGSNNYKNTVIGCLGDNIPVLICTDLSSQEQWDRMVEGKLTAADRLEMSVMGLM